ncbi:MAG: type I restriction-modification system subunit M [Actinobacteria bacterium]|nr:type I restriction-modification system subunit M [Actinomycetota bacterium]
MAIKKSDLYRSIWDSCDELRGGMDASQYKDYVLTLLFVKYVSDKHAADPHSLIVVPEMGSFDYIHSLVGDKEIGDKINKAIGRLAEANDLQGVIDLADFNDSAKLGSGKDKVDRLSALVNIFHRRLDFSDNLAAGDDLLGDAYEYLMRHFASEAGKSKGQFYTPAEVSRIIAQVIGIGPHTTRDETVYDPTAGSGSLLLKAADEAGGNVTVYGQEIDNATWALARMNMFLHGQPTHDIARGNTLAAPEFIEKGRLKTFNFVVANPPFSTKSWSNGIDPKNDDFNRFEYGVPPTRNGDYAFLLHVIKSLKSTGTGAVVLPHGVLFRGNAEAVIRRNLLQRGLIKGVIGLPANLFYGTGIPACIVVVDKKEAGTRHGVFLIDASRGYIRDGNKNRLREQDIHRIVDVFRTQRDIDGYSRLVPLEEIASDANAFNLNISRYIDSSDREDIHDLTAHLHGGIPRRDVDELEHYWQVMPDLRTVLFEPAGRDGYVQPAVEADHVRETVESHPQFEAFAAEVRQRFEQWADAHREKLRSIDEDTSPKELRIELAEDLLDRFADVPLVSRYDVYQRFMDFWDADMQDDVYLIVSEGWEVGRSLREARDREAADFAIKKGRKKVQYVADLLPPSLLIGRYFPDRQEQLDELSAAVATAEAELAEFEEEHAVEGGALDGLEGSNGVTKGNAQDRVAELKDLILDAFPDDSLEYEQAKGIAKTKFGTRTWEAGVEDPEGYFAELDILHRLLALSDGATSEKAALRETETDLIKAAMGKYEELDESAVRGLTVDDKWISSLRSALSREIDGVVSRLAGRIAQLVQRYDTTLPELVAETEDLSARVAKHLEAMGVEVPV